MHLLILGTLALDSIETSFGKKEKIGGGSAIYSAVAASLLATNIHIVSIAGEDFPQSYIDILHRRGINTEGVQIKKGKNHSSGQQDTIVT